jgi:putative peptide zinc metalloprotease protein
MMNMRLRVDGRLSTEPSTDGDQRHSKPPVSLPECPKIAVVDVTDPAPSREDVVVCCPERNKYIRIQGPQWSFLRSLDGRRTIAELERDFEGQLPDGMVRPLLTRFTELGLLEGDVHQDGSQNTTHRGSGRLRVTHAGVIQITLVNPDKLLNRLIPLCRILGGPTGRIVSALVVMVGLASMAVHAELIALIPHRLTDPVWMTTLVAALLASFVLHELGHAAAVKYYGGRVHRMGLMLLYLVPALFCDTSDAWRLPRNRQRVIVAAAGIWVQMVIAGLAQIALWLPIRMDVAAWLWLFALVNLGLCGVNLIPFLKLDGYWVLVALTGVPNLRADALRYLKGRALHLVAGLAQPRTPSPAHPILTALFGLGCLLFPPCVLLTVLLDLQHALLTLGRIGALAWLVLAGQAIAIPRKGLLRMVRSVRGLPRHARIRVGLVSGVAILVLAGAVTLIRIPLTIQGRYEVSDAGEIIAIVPAEAGARLRAGDRAHLRGLSPVHRAPIAAGMLTGHAERAGQEVRYQVALDGGEEGDISPSAAGLLSIRAGEVTAPSWFRTSYLRPVLSTLRGR